jgi:hypothetical protein
VPQQTLKVLLSDFFGVAGVDVVLSQKPLPRGLGLIPFEMQQQIFMFEATKQTKQQYNVPTRHSIHTPSYGVTCHCHGILLLPLYTAVGPHNS